MRYPCHCSSELNTIIYLPSVSTALNLPWY